MPTSSPAAEAQPVPELSKSPVGGQLQAGLPLRPASGKRRNRRLKAPQSDRL